MSNKIINIKNIFEKKEWEDDKKTWENVTKSSELKEKCKSANCVEELGKVSVGKDDGGFFIYGQKARSKSYSSQEDILVDDVRTIASKKKDKKDKKEDE